MAHRADMQTKDDTMHVKGRMKELFDAFSRIGARAFENPRLVSCTILSKAPQYDNVLRRFLIQAPIRPVSFLQAFDLILRYYLKNIGQYFLLVLARLAISVAGWKASPLSKGNMPTLVIDSFLLVPKVMERKRFNELYLPGLAEEAEKQGWYPVFMLRFHGFTNPRMLSRTFKILHDHPVNALTGMHLFTCGDWMRLLWHVLAYPVAHWKLIRSLKTSLHDSPEAYIRDALIHCLPQDFTTGEARRIAGRRLAEKLDAKARIVSWHENRTGNKAFYLGLHEAEEKTGRHIPTIGAQLFNWPDALLSSHPDDAEVPLHLTPDRVLVNGPYYMPAASTQKYAPGPSLRHQALFEKEEGKTLAPHPEKPVLVLLTSHPTEIERVLTMVRDAKLPENPVFKFHPTTRVEEYQALLPGSPTLVSGSLYTALEEASVVIGCGSADLAESVALGLPAVVIEEITNIPGLDLNYLPEAGHGPLWHGVRRAEDLPGAIESLKKHLVEPERDTRVKAFRDLIFTNPTPDAIVESFDLKRD